ncbi:20S proteasome subunit beta 7 [Pancytospora philotis]|nr:20S proteasome subunit beta 7 [Pancytospora philotis]
MSVTTSSVVCFAYKTGVIMAADTAGAYGSLALTDFTKIYKLTPRCLAGFSGAVADIQYLHQLVTAEIANDPRPIDPQGIHKMIQLILYERRSKLELLNISVIVCGINRVDEGFGATDEGGKMVGVVNSKGNFWFDSAVASGIAQHLVIPTIRERRAAVQTKEEAVALMEECMRVLCYKDCKASNVIQMGFCDENETVVTKPYALETNWDIGLADDETVL